MAENKLSYDQIADKNLLDPLINELKEVQKQLKLVNNELKNTVESSNELAQTTPTDSFENLKKVEKALDDVKKSSEELDKVEKDRLKLQDRIAELEDVRIKKNFDLKEQIRLQTKALRDSAKEAASSTKSYDALKKSTNKAQIEFKELATQFGANSKEAKIARQRFDDLDEQLREVNDAAKDGRRDVGRYEKAMSGLNNTIGKLGVIAVIVKLFELATDAFNSNSQGAARLEKVIKAVTVTVSVFVNRLVVAFPIAQAKFNLFFLGLEKGFAEIKNLFGNNEEDVARLTKAYDDLSKEAGKSLIDAFKGIGAEIDDLVEKSDNLIDSTAKNRKEIIRQKEAIAELIPIQRELEAIAGDQTTSLQEQITAQQALTAVTDQRLGREVKIAKLTFDLALQNAQVNKFNIEAQEELAEATIALAEAEAEQLGMRVENFKEVNQFLSDQLELNLDFYVDDFDNLKTVNERIITDVTQTFNRRRELLDLNLKLAQDSFDNEQKILNDSLLRKGKAIIDFDALSASTSAKENARVIEASGLSEQLGIRALEIIREKRTVLQDNAEAQRDLNAAEQDGNDIKTDLILTDQAILELQEKGVDVAIVLQKLTEKRLENDIENLRVRLTLANDGSAEFLTINQELNELLLEQNQQRITEEEEQQKKSLEKQKELQETVFGVISDIVRKRGEERLSQIEDEISAEQERANALRALAAEGNEDAQKNIAVTQKRLAEAELERERQLQRQKKSEFVLSAIETYSSKVANDDPNPLASTISDVSILRAFLGTIQGFFDGTEDTGSSGMISDEHGKITGFTHENERVINANQNKLVGGMSNMELAMLAYNHQNSNDVQQSSDSSQVVSELRDLKRVIKQKPDHIGTHYDAHERAIVEVIKKGNTMEKKHIKTGGIWGR